jgi:hypothetical protein
VGEKFKDPVVHEDNCQCTDIDYEWCVSFRYYFRLRGKGFKPVTTILSEMSNNVSRLGLSLFPQGYAQTLMTHTWALLDGGRYQATLVKEV